MELGARFVSSQTVLQRPRMSTSMNLSGGHCTAGNGHDSTRESGAHRVRRLGSTSRGAYRPRPGSWGHRVMSARASCGAVELGRGRCGAVEL